MNAYLCVFKQAAASAIPHLAFVAPLHRHVGVARVLLHLARRAEVRRFRLEGGWTVDCRSYRVCRHPLPERINETDHLITKHTGPEALVWHTDGARCYRHLPCRTSVKHAKKIWSAVRKVKLSEDDVLVCYGGTQLQDGLWSHLKNAIPRTLNTAQELSIDTLNKYASCWVWKFRRSVSLDLFSELGATVRAAREAGDIW
jgi:hypothetical protein